MGMFDFLSDAGKKLFHPILKQHVFYKFVLLREGLPGLHCYWHNLFEIDICDPIRLLHIYHDNFWQMNSEYYRLYHNRYSLI